MNEILEALSPLSYYAGLSKKDKGKLLAYLALTYGLNYSTICRKLSGARGCVLNTLERMACNEAIKNERLWK